MRGPRQLLVDWFDPDLSRLLASLGTPEAVTALMDACRAGLGRLRNLHSVGNPMAVEVLCAGLDDADARVQGACADALWRIASERPESPGLLPLAVRQRVSRIRITCPDCNGSGQADAREDDVYYGRTISASCDRCSGQGHYLRADRAFLEPAPDHAGAV